MLQPIGKKMKKILPMILLLSISLPSLASEIKVSCEKLTTFNYRPNQEPIPTVQVFTQSIGSESIDFD
jgi:hypothetical protein